MTYPTQAEMNMFVNRRVELGGKLFWTLKKKGGKIYLVKVVKKGGYRKEKSLGPVDLIEKIIDEWKKKHGKQRVRVGAGGRARTSDHRVNRQGELWDSKLAAENSSTRVFAGGEKIWWNKPSDDFLDWLRGQVEERTFKDYVSYWRRVPERFDVGVVREQCRQSRWFQYLYSKIAEYLWQSGLVSLEDKERIRAAARVRGLHREKAGAPEVDLSSFKRTLELFEQRRPAIALYYIIMYYSGARLEEAAHLVQHAKEKRVVDLGNSVRVIMNYSRGKKRCDYLYLPKWVYQQILEHEGEKPSARTVSSYIKNLNKRHKLGLVPPKYMRKLHRQLLKKLGVDYEIREFIQNRISKLSVGERRYEALLADADRTYPTIAEQLKQLLESDRGG